MYRGGKFRKLYSKKPTPKYSNIHEREDFSHCPSIPDGGVDIGQLCDHPSTSALGWLSMTWGKLANFLRLRSSVNPAHQAHNHSCMIS